MQIQRKCSNCEFDFDGKCAGSSDVYEYGSIIDDSENVCSGWSANRDYFSFCRSHAPRFLRELEHTCKLSWDEFYTNLESIANHQPVEINIFDAVKSVYGLSITDIAVLLDVSFGVMYRAKTQGVTAKRLQQLVDCLCIPENYFFSITTNDFDMLHECKSEFLSHNKSSFSDIIHSRQPKWKQELSSTISAILRCPIDKAKVFTGIDRMFWNSSMDVSEFTESEQALISFLTRSTKNHSSPFEFEFFLDFACKPHLHMTMHDPEVTSK